jgi:hypothetical protein
MPGWRDYLLTFCERLARRPERLEYRDADFGIRVEGQPQTARSVFDGGAHLGLNETDQVAYPNRICGDEIKPGLQHDCSQELLGGVASVLTW